MEDGLHVLGTQCVVSREDHLHDALVGRDVLTDLYLDALLLKEELILFDVMISGVLVVFFIGPITTSNKEQWLFLNENFGQGVVS